MPFPYAAGDGGADGVSGTLHAGTAGTFVTGIILWNVPVSGHSSAAHGTGRLSLSGMADRADTGQGGAGADAPDSPALREELGASDLAGQAETLEQYRMQLEPYTAAAAERCQRLQRLYVSMGVLCGLLLAILLC